MRNRNIMLEHLATLQAHSEPILIVGAGINGIGLYRDLALQNIPAIMVDKGDFGGGTTAASSRLIHGGLRYLETGEFELVRESVFERNGLLSSAPHLIKPLPVLVPVTSYFGGLINAGLRFLGLKKRPGAKGLAVLKIGLLLFDRFGYKNRNMPKHRILDASEKSRELPGLASNVKAVAEYYDARMVHPERLALEIIEDAEEDCPDSLALNYMSVVGSDGNTVKLKDEISGQVKLIRPRHVINCGGAWVDQVNALLGIEKRMVGGTRGSHLLLERPDLAGLLAGKMLYFETFDHRACLIYPVNKTRVLMGTTDIRTANPEIPICSDNEIDYIFRVVEEVLPGSDLKRDHIVFTYSGVRPLPKSNDAQTGSISRDHRFYDLPAEGNRGFPILVLVGGKWTTYRACAEQLLDKLLPQIGEVRKASTLGLSIGGGHPVSAWARAKVWESLEAIGLDDVDIDKLLARYGSKLPHVAKHIALTPGKVKGTSYFEGEILWLINSGRVATLSDVLIRRTLITYEDVIGQDVITAVANLCAVSLDWSSDRTAAEVEATLLTLKERHLINVV